MNSEINLATKSLFDVARQDAARALTLKRGAEETVTTMGKIKNLIEEGAVPTPGVRFAFENEVEPDLADSLWTTLKQKSENPLEFVSVLKSV